jgi:shikimate dehydrogenase
VAGERNDVNVAGVIGSPVAHSLSPAIHNAAFQAAGLDWAYVAFEVAPGRAGAALDAVRVLGIRGLSVTTPHKEDVADGVDALAAAAATLHSVNTVVVTDSGCLVGHSTDGDGCVAALAAAGVDVAGAAVAVVGAGAAARSVIDALGRGEARDVAVVNRTAGRAEEAARLTAVARVGSADDIAAADVVVNATSVGFGTDEVPFDPALLRPGHAVADLVYHPLETALLRAASAAGCTVIDGLATLIHQAVLQNELWTGLRPDPGVMRAAALAELRRRAGGA